jgi:hypothetical protein
MSESKRLAYTFPVFSYLFLMSFLKKHKSDFLEKAQAQSAVAPSLEFKAKELLNQYSAMPKTPFTVDQIFAKCGLIRLFDFSFRLSSANSELIRRPSIGVSVGAGVIAEGLDCLLPASGDQSLVFSPQVLDLFQSLKVCIFHT